MCRLPSHLSQPAWPYITSCCHCITANHFDGKQWLENLCWSFDTDETRDWSLMWFNTLSFYIFERNKQKIIVLKAKQGPKNYSLLLTVSPFLVFCRKSCSDTYAGHQLGEIPRWLVNIPLSILAKQSDYIFRDKKIFSMVGELKLINWTMNTLNQQHKKSTEAYSNCTKYGLTMLPTRQHCHSQEHSTQISWSHSHRDVYYTITCFDNIILAAYHLRICPSC